MKSSTILDYAVINQKHKLQTVSCHLHSFQFEVHSAPKMHNFL